VDPELRAQWDAFSPAYQSAMDISTYDVHYGPMGPGESRLSLLGDVRDRKTLEVGCGGGQNSIALSRAGARATGLDFSAAQIRYARSLARRCGVDARFVEWDADHLGEFPERDWDLVLAVFAVEYVADLASFCRSVFELTAAGGIFVLCDLHPFVSGADVVDASMAEIARSIDYFRRRPIEFEWSVADRLPAARLRRFHRTLSDYVRALLDAGFSVRSMAEPETELVEAPEAPGFAYRDVSIQRQSTVWHKLPYTLIITAEKGAQR
jgi:SAM-dependent methyltransferase